MKTFLGIELGSTRIKAVLVDEKGAPLATGGFDWENRFENEVWTYSLDDVWSGLAKSFSDLCVDYKEKTGKTSPDISCIGISAMMHGYIALDEDDTQLAEFRTWRNTITEQEAEILTENFNFNVPQRWTISHLYLTLRRKEAYINDIAYVNTLASYVHYKLTGEKVVGIGDASGIFPIDSKINTYDKKMVEKFDQLASEYSVPWKLLDILPKVLVAGENAGYLTTEGALLLDPMGRVKAGIPLCPAEGDAGTGMVATNSVTPFTGNVSAGTSVFAMLTLDKALSKVYPEIDMVTTPSGNPVAMAHCNNCTSDIDAWIGLFSDIMTKMGQTPDKTQMYLNLYNAALNGDSDCGGLVSINYLSGEHTSGFLEGRPLFARTPDSLFTVENFMRSLLFSSISTLKIGMDILTEKENVKLSKIHGHGGMFKTPVVGQKIMAGVLDLPVAVMDSAGEGGAWGIALLAVYAADKNAGQSLENFLESRVFKNSSITVINPDPADVEGFKSYFERYKKALEIERTAVDVLENIGK